MKFFVALVATACCALPTASLSISWTGYANNNQWDTGNNWYPNQIPGPNDDVTINKGKVELTTATGVNSLVMGNDFSSPANLTIFKAFYIGSGGVTVQGNGNLFINTGLDQVTGQVNVAGKFFFIDGAIGGQWTTNINGIADLSAAGEKALIGCQLTTEGQLKLGGVIVMNQSSVVKANGATISTNVIIQAGDNTPVLFDSSKGAFTFSTGLLSLQAPVKIGTFTLVSGNMSLYSDITFNAVLNVPEGSFVYAFGKADTNFPVGATGAGVMTFMNRMTTISGLNMVGDVNFGGGSAFFNGTKSTIGVLTLLGSHTNIAVAVACKQLNLLNGIISGSSTITASNVYTKTNGFTLNSAVAVTGAVSFDHTTLTFGASGKFTIESTAFAQTIGSLQLVGPAYISGLINNGAFTVSSTMSTQNIDITGTGSFAVSSSLTVNTASLKQSKVTLASGAIVKGQNTILSVPAIAAKTEGTTVKAVIGKYLLECPQQCEKVATTDDPTQSFSFTV